jgi:NADH-quinone oxidoreductase subunit J
LAFALLSSGISFDPSAAKVSVELTSKNLFNVNSDGPGYYLLFEGIGLLLLSAMVAAVLMAKKNLSSKNLENNEEEI